MLSHRLRHRIHFQKQHITQDEYGTPVIDWQTATVNGVLLDSVPAEVLTGPGREFIASAAKQAAATARINLRWFPGLDAAWRILWDGRVYNIESIETDITARREWRLRCTDGVNDGR